MLARLVGRVDARSRIGEPSGRRRVPWKWAGRKPLLQLRRAALRQGQFGHHDVAGQVLVLRAESVGRPRADRRIAAEAAAGVHVEQGLGMVERFGLAAAVVAQFVGHFGVGQVLPLVAHLDAGLADLAETERDCRRRT